MSPLIALIIGEIAKQVPSLAIDLIRILKTDDATEADWDALRARWDRSGDSFFKTPKPTDKGE